MSGEGAVVEVDKTLISNKEGATKRRGYAHKRATLSLVKRGCLARSFHVGGTAATQLVPILRANIAKETAITIDESGQYGKICGHSASHNFTIHSAKEYLWGEVDTNTVEYHYIIFKRCIKGGHQYCMNEFCF